MFSIETVTVHPSVRKSAGVREYPAPLGLPVEMKVPAGSVAQIER